MDRATVGGLILAWVVLIASLLMEGGHRETIANLPALILILGGSLGITFVAVPREIVKALLNVARVEQRHSLGEGFFSPPAKDMRRRSEASAQRSFWSMRWLLTYADAIALLVAFFVMLYSISLLDRL
jgi:hypothetical protein